MATYFTRSLGTIQGTTWNPISFTTEKEIIPLLGSPQGGCNEKQMKYWTWSGLTRYMGALSLVGNIFWRVWPSFKPGEQLVWGGTLAEKQTVFYWNESSHQSPIPMGNWSPRTKITENGIFLQAAPQTYLPSASVRWKTGTDVGERQEGRTVSAKVRVSHISHRDSCRGSEGYRARWGRPLDWIRTHSRGFASHTQDGGLCSSQLILLLSLPERVLSRLPYLLSSQKGLLICTLTALPSTPGRASASPMGQRPSDHRLWNPGAPHRFPGK